MSDVQPASLAPAIHLAAAELDAMQRGSHVVGVPDALFRVEGSGALQCVQGIFTNDIVKCAPDALRWGGVLTPKGMIIFDMWVLRDGDATWMIVPAMAHAEATALFRRTFPPRIARVTDHSSSMSACWYLGGGVASEPNAVVAPDGPAPFAALGLGPDPVGHAATLGRLEAPPGWASAACLLAGWPVLGNEIDDRTLPQEVRFDELAGVRYDKGCYTGQETVARLHFRGHPNRTLRGLVWDAGPPTGIAILQQAKAVGSVSRWGVVAGRTIGLAKLRREVGTGDVVDAGGVSARVVDLPFEVP